MYMYMLGGKNKVLCTHVSFYCSCHVNEDLAIIEYDLQAIIEYDLPSLSYLIRLTSVEQ